MKIYMTKWVMIALLLFIILLAGYLINISFKKTIDKTESKSLLYKNKVGEKFILDKDTLTIVDYSVLFETFTLSNNIKVDSKLILK